MTERTMDDKALNPAEMDTLKQAGYLPMGGGVVGEQILVRFAHEDSVYSATRAQWRIIIAELAKSPILTPAEPRTQYAHDRLSALNDHADLQMYGPDLLIGDVQTILAEVARLQTGINEARGMLITLFDRGALLPMEMSLKAQEWRAALEGRAE